MNSHDYSQTDDIYEARRKRSRLSSIQGGANSHTMLIHSPATYTESQELVLQLKQNKQSAAHIRFYERRGFCAGGSGYQNLQGDLFIHFY